MILGGRGQIVWRTREDKGCGGAVLSDVGAAVSRC